MNVVPYLFANTYPAFSPSLAAVVSVVCRADGQLINCPDSLYILIPTVLSVIAVLIALMIASLWRIFNKAGQPGWMSAVPIYNAVILLHVVKKPTWWIVLQFIPLVNTVIAVAVTYELAKVFGKGIWYTIGLIFLPFIFYPMLGFGKAAYRPVVN